MNLKYVTVLLVLVNSFLVVLNILGQFGQFRIEFDSPLRGVRNHIHNQENSGQF